MFFPRVAGVARDVHFPIRKLGIDLIDHRDHAAGHLFLRIVILGKVPSHMAEVTVLCAQRDLVREHDLPDVRVRQHLQVFMRHSATAFLGRILFGSILRQKKRCGNEKNCG